MAKEHIPLLNGARVDCELFSVFIRQFGHERGDREIAVQVKDGGFVVVQRTQGDPHAEPVIDIQRFHQALNLIGRRERHVREERREEERGVREDINDV